MENSNWSTREKHAAARWLFTYRYGELIGSSREIWRAHHGKPPTARARATLDEFSRKLHTLARAGDAGVPLSQVVWTELADHFLCGIPGYADIVRGAGTQSASGPG